MFLTSSFAFFLINSFFEQCFAKPIYRSLFRDINQPACLAKLPDNVYSCVIVGGGIGGLTSAIYLSQLGCNTLVLQGQEPGGALSAASSVQNWPGEIAIKGSCLVEKLENHARHYGAVLSQEVLEAVDFSRRPFKLTLKSSRGGGQDRTIYALTCIIATGATPTKLNVPGEAEFWGRGVGNCAVCDGPLYKDKVVAVVGSSDKALSQVDLLSIFAKKIYIIEQGQRLENTGLKALNAKNNPKVEIMLSTSIEEICGKPDGISHVIVNSREHGRKKLELSGVFVMLGSSPNSAFLKNQLKIDEKGLIKLISGQMTSVPGVFAVGEVCSEKYWQAVCAAGQGCVAALQVFESLPNKIALENIEVEKLKPKIKLDEKNIEQKAQKNSKLISVERLCDLKAHLAGQEKPYIIFFSSNWCFPCKAMKLIIEDLANDFSDKIYFFKSDVSKNPELAYNFNVSATPTIIFFNGNGAFFKQFIGKESKELLRLELGKLISNNSMIINQVY